MPIAKFPSKLLFIYYQMWGVVAERFYVVTTSGRQTFKSLGLAREFAKLNGFAEIKVKYV